MDSRALYLDQPLEVAIETLALCNAACSFCPYPQLERKGRRLSEEVLFELIGQMSLWQVPFVFSPFKVNEPLLDLRLPEICREFLDRCSTGSLRLFTNGSALNHSNMSWIAKLRRLKHLWVSLNSVDEEEHQALMQFKQPMLNRILEKLTDLHERKRLGSFSHEVMLSRVATGTAEDMKFLKTCRNRYPRFNAMLIKRDAWLQDVSAPEIPIPVVPCSRWWELSITAQGDAVLCCMVSEPKPGLVLGSIHEHTMLELYNLPFWRERREKMLNRHAVPICRQCSY